MSKQRAENVQKQIDKFSTSPDQKAQLLQERAGAVSNIIQIGNTNSGRADVNLAAGKALDEVGEPKKALPFAQQAVALAERQGDQKLLPQALLAEGRVRYELGDYPGAAQAAKKVLGLEPKNRAAAVLYGLTHGRGSDADAPQASAVSDNDRPSIDSPRKTAYSSAKESTPAPASAAAATRTIDPDLLKAAELLRQARQTMALDPGLSLKLADKALALNPRSAAARAARAQAELALKDPAAALKDASAAVALDPKKASAYAARGQAKLALGYPPAETLADLKKAAELDPSLGSLYTEALSRGAPARPAAASSSPLSVAFGPPRRAGTAGLSLLVLILLALWLRRNP